MRGEPNDKLRQARERVESPGATGESLSRQELAELVNAWLYTYKGRTVELDANYIGKLEQGTIRWPQDTDRREAFRAVLGAATDADLGFRRPRRTRSARPECQQVVSGVMSSRTGAGLGQSTAELLACTQPTRVPSVAGMAEVRDVRNAAMVFGSWDSRYGSGLVREAVTAQLRHCVELLSARCTARVRTEMFTAVGYLAHVTGFMAFDAYAHDDARRMFRFALSCAEEAGNWHLRAKVLSSMARQAIWCGDLDSGLTYTELALVRADRLTATERAMLHTARARALAKFGRVQDTASAIGLADDEFSQSRPLEDPPWMAYYDSAQHHGDTGHALWDTAAAGHFVSEARQRLTVAVAGHDAGHARSRAISQIKLASLTMAVGDPAEGAVLGDRALEWVGPVRSCRAADDLRDLRRLGRPHAHLTDVAALCERIGAAVGR